MPAQGNTKTEVALTLLRVVPASFMIVFHGWAKLLAAGQYLLAGEEWRAVAGVAGLGFPFPAFFAVCSALAESVVAALLAAGIFTRYAAAILSFNMSVAVYSHVTTDMRFEFAAVYLTIFLALMIAPPSRFSADGLRRK